MAWTEDPQAAPVGKRWTADYQPTRTANAIGARASPPKKQRRAHAMARGTEEEERAALVEAAQAEVATLLASSATPITRPQWAVWLDEHLAEFHERMKTASARRRAGNTRLRARQNLPDPVPRFQPRSTLTKLTQMWTKHLSGRTGWHGLQTETEKEDVLLDVQRR